MNESLLVVLRVLHIAAASAVVGAVVFQAFAVVPTLRQLDEHQRAQLSGGFATRWRSIAFLMIGILLLTGLVNFLLFKIPEFREHPSKGLYHALFGIKFLLALAAFHSATVLVLPGEKGDRYRARAGGRLWLLTFLFAAIIILAAVMRYFNELFPADRPAA
jgi:hypothetical protein